MAYSSLFTIVHLQNNDDYRNEPMKTGGGLTQWIYAIEGDWTYHIQEIVLNDFQLIFNMSVPIHVPVYDLVFTNVLHYTFMTKLWR